MPRTVRTRLVAVAGLALAVLAAACGGGASAAGPSTLPTLPPSFASTTSTLPRVTAPDGSTVPSVETTTTTTTIPPAVWPLTGLPGADVPRAALPALVVKIDNHPRARPQIGLVQADIVIEEIVEGITRFFAVFHSTAADPVGPVRSARTTDIDLLRQLQRPLFAWSGANNGTIKALRDADVATDVGYAFHSKEAGYYRDGARRSPHNLFSTTTALWALSPAGCRPAASDVQVPGRGSAGRGRSRGGRQADDVRDEGAVAVGPGRRRVAAHPGRPAPRGRQWHPHRAGQRRGDVRGVPPQPGRPHLARSRHGRRGRRARVHRRQRHRRSLAPARPVQARDAGRPGRGGDPPHARPHLGGALAPRGANVVPAGTDPATVPYPSAK